MEPHRILAMPSPTLLEVRWSDQSLGVAVLRYAQAFALVETPEVERLGVGTLVSATLAARGRTIATVLPGSRPIRVTVEAVGMTRAEADELIHILQCCGLPLQCDHGKS
jgi:hypothetical protein